MIQEYFIESPAGVIHLCIQNQAIVSLCFAEGSGVDISEGLFARRCRKQLEEYFRGERKVFTLPYQVSGTPFQKKVLSAAAAIPYARTVHYSELARCAGYPDAYRAAGTVLRNNPLLLLIPCHRVIGKSGALKGYAGGVKRKQYLLELEEKYR